MSPPNDENGESQQQGTCFLPVESCFLQCAMSTMPREAGTELPFTISSPLILVWESKSHMVLLSLSLFPYQIYTNKLHLFDFQLGLIKSAIKTIKKEANETILNITINVKHFKYNHSNKSRKTL